MATKKSDRGKTKSRANGKRSRPARGSKSPPEKLSALNAAARVLSEKKEPMSCPELIEAMAAKGYWKSPGGKTPAATLYSALTREITTKKGQSRFEKSAP